MADTGDKSALLAAVAQAAQQAPRGLPPVHLWNPPHCGAIDIRIRGDGVWLHEGSPIARPELVRLFASVLRKDPEGYCLVTPVEKLLIQVDDLPFRAVAVEATTTGLLFTTDAGDTVDVGPEFPLVVETDGETGEPAPRLRVRADLWARVARSVFYELVDMASVEDGQLILRSNGAAFVLGSVAGGPA